MSTSMIDSIFFKDLYGTDEMRAVFEDLNLLQKWLDAEVALAKAEAELGIIPRAAAEEITRCARAEKLDTAKLKKLIDDTVHPIVPLIRVLKDACSGGHGEYIHWGATTQDIMDTATVLQLKQAYPILEKRLAAFADVLRELAVKYRDTPMAGRTHGQQALPVTFGFKIAVWLAEIQRHQERFAQCKPRVLVGQFSGAAGTLASLTEQGLQVQQRMMDILGLGVPPISWHSARDSFAEFTSVLGMIGATAGKVAHEVISLQRTEIWEVEEPFVHGKVGSSTMPHKRNPMLCEAALGLARLIMHRVPSSLDAMIAEHERDWASEQMEWAFLPEACIMTDGVLAMMTNVMKGLHVHPDRMEKNLNAMDGLMLSEAVMLALGKHVGRQTAHDVVYECAMKAVEERRPFRKLLSERAEVTKHLSEKEIDVLLDPHRYTGLSAQFVDRVTKRQF
jgi:3-carboxy-cis,cis-muconate cycloisomerase